MAQKTLTQADLNSLPEEKGPYELPEGWKWVKVRKLLSGKPTYGLSLRSHRTTSGVPFIRMNNIAEGNIDISDLKYVELDDKLLAKFRLRKGDLLFNRTNSLDLVGKTAVFQLDGDFVFASYLIRLRLYLSVCSPKFINYYLNLEPTRMNLKKLATQATNQANINAKKISEFIIPLPFKDGKPDLNKQEEIVAKIEEIFSRVDKAIKLRQDALNKTEKIFQNVLEEIFREAKEDKEDWKWVKLGDEKCFHVETGGTPSTNIKEYWLNGNIPFITPKDLGKNNSKYIYEYERRITYKGLENSSAKLVPPKTIVLSTRAPIGHLAITTEESRNT